MYAMGKRFGMFPPWLKITLTYTQQAKLDVYYRRCSNQCLSPTLARLIQAVLFKPSSSELWCSPSTRVPLIWVLTLGGIAANDAPERAWFASALGDVTRRTGLNSWASIKSVLATMLWYEAACDRAAEDLWQEGASKYSYAIQ